MGLHNLSFLQNPIQHGKGGRIFLHNYPPNQYKAFIKYFFEAVQNLTLIVYILLLLNIFYLFIFIKSFLKISPVSILTLFYPAYYKGFLKILNLFLMILTEKRNVLYTFFLKFRLTNPV